ncbi:MAG: type II toxin-antitoxin system RelE/ParE family toxin [Candidatus Pacearchaeota archaeon]
MSKVKDKDLKSKVKSQVRKIISDPEVGKPMKYGRKGTRELYVKPYRLSYLYLKKENKMVLLDVYHKDKQ